jgi:hypothetical protein
MGDHDSYSDFEVAAVKKQNLDANKSVWFLQVPSA